MTCEIHGESCELEGEPLLSRRDRFAAAALTGLLSTTPLGIWASDTAARKALEYADALIYELDKVTP